MQPLAIQLRPQTLEDIYDQEHLRNAPTHLMKKLDYGKGYQYDHNYPHAVAATQTYFPEKLKVTSFYHHTSFGFEIKLKEKMQWLEEIRENAQE